MFKDPEELKKQPVYRAVARVTGTIKNRLLEDAKNGKKPAHIIKQALEMYYKSNNGSY